MFTFHSFIEVGNAQRLQQGEIVDLVIIARLGWTALSQWLVLIFLVLLKLKGLFLQELCVIVNC
jgi:hypothetical protein